MPPKTDCTSVLSNGPLYALDNGSANLPIPFSALPKNLNLPGNLFATFAADLAKKPGPLPRRVPSFAALNIFFLFATYGNIEPAISPVSS